MVVLCHWHSVRYWQKNGQDLGVGGSKWREAHGGNYRTVGKSIGFMVLGLFGSFVCDGVALLPKASLFPTKKTTIMAYPPLKPL
jgi:hypothetical protein